MKKSSPSDNRHNFLMIIHCYDFHIINYLLSHYNLSVMVNYTVNYTQIIIILRREWFQEELLLL